MRYIIGALVILMVGLYFTIGIRIGYVTLMPTYMWNATGQNEYAYRTVEDQQQVGLKGKCQVKSGKATLGIYAPDGTLIGGQECKKPGTWSLNLVAGGKVGMYHVRIKLEKFTGKMELSEFYAGAK